MVSIRVSRATKPIMRLSVLALVLLTLLVVCSRLSRRECDPASHSCSALPLSSFCPLLCLRTLSSAFLCAAAMSVSASPHTPSSQAGRRTPVAASPASGMNGRTSLGHGATPLHPTSQGRMERMILSNFKSYDGEHSVPFVDFTAGQGGKHTGEQRDRASDRQQGIRALPIVLLRQRSLASVSALAVFLSLLSLLFSLLQ